MQINELKEGQFVIIQSGRKSKTKFEIITKVIGTDGPAILVESASQSENELNDSLTYNVYASISMKDIIVWRKVDIQSRTVGNRTFYRIDAHDKDCKTVIAERRDHKRLPMHGLRANLVTYSTPLPIVLNDISQNGISFLSPLSNLQEEVIKIEFTDVIQNRSFAFHLDCQFIRMTTTADNNYLYGCRLIEHPENYNTYLSAKTLVEALLE